MTLLLNQSATVKKNSKTNAVERIHNEGKRGEDSGTFASSVTEHLNSGSFLMRWSNTSVNWESIPFDFMDQRVSMQPALAC